MVPVFLSCLLGRVSPINWIWKLNSEDKKCTRPLALYAFSNDRVLLDKLIENTLSGGVTINDCAMHVAQHDLPFGGIGNSGIGQYHGYEGFVEFSKLRPVFKQAKKVLAVAPPYGATFNNLYKLITKIKWIA